MGYPNGLLKTRAVIKKYSYAVIPPEGRVINSIPGFQDCLISVLASPRLGANFVAYIVEVLPQGKTTFPFARREYEEAFIYVLGGDGELAVTIDKKQELLKQGGYAFSPEAVGMDFCNNTGSSVRLFMYKQRYEKLVGHAAYPYFGNANNIKEVIYENMENVFIKDLLPMNDMGFDVNFHILSFEPTGCHPFIETHVQEHAAYVTNGEGLYLLGDDWIQIQKEDFIWFGAFTQQGVYATGRSRLSYIYSKDFNRDPQI